MKWVLLVDDNDSDRQLLRYNFDWHGYRVVEASNGLEGLEQARNCKELDLIVSDAVMPLIDGFHFLQSIKHDPTLKHIPFIFYSAVYTSLHNEQFALRMGAQAFISKPKGRMEFWTELCKTLIDPIPPFPFPKSQTLDLEEFHFEHSRMVDLQKADKDKK